VFLMTRGLPVLLELGLTIFCLIDCIQTPQIAVRNLPKWGWIVLILIFPLIGGISWLVAGRPLAGQRPQDYVTGFLEYRSGSAGPLGPDDDPAYLRELGRMNSEHEQMLRTWEDDLRRREQELRRRDGDPGDGGAPSR
jgi:Phospholipase_D-nuclease N-terminal